LNNWSIMPSSTTLAAGEVVFTATHDEMHAHGSNEGGATHQLLIARLPDGAKAGEGKYDEMVLNLTDIKPGETKAGSAQFTPGRYELACLVVETVNGKSVSHYDKGMFTTVVVK